MQFIHSIKKKISLALPALLIVSVSSAQNADTTAANTAGSGSNLLAILLIVTAAVLAFVIWGMGQVLIAVSKQVLDKKRNTEKILSAGIIIGLALISQATFAQAPAAADAVKEIPNYGGLSANTYYAFLCVIGVEVAAILFLAFSIRRVYTELLPEKPVAVHTESKLKIWWSNIDKKFFTRAVPVEKEADVMLDHDYDGIRELDNSLPPWWKYGFIITIVVAFIYLANFHLFGIGKSPTEEYAIEMENARIQKEIFESNNKDKIDEANVPVADATGLARGKEIFTTKCWPCHGKNGEGGAGPNLTDDYWIHKGSLNDIYHSIKVGYQDKGMQSWAKDYTPKEISFIASYIKTLKGTNPPNAKAPQGDLYIEQGKTDAATPVNTDTTVVKTDSVKTTK